MCLPREHNELIEAVSECNPNVVVILIGGAPMELPWIHKVKSVLLAYLSGEGMGKAITNLLLGFKSPCGKLAETWPLSLKDTPSYHNFPGSRLTVEYRESIYVGYRYYEKAEKQVMYPFGHGLSYVNFKYSNLKLDGEAYSLGKQIQLTFYITNCGDMVAHETAFIFVAQEHKTVYLPKKELREFVKVHLNPGETKQVSVTIDTSTLGYYNAIIKDWYLESGIYHIMICSSSEDCKLQASIYMNSQEMPQPDFTKSASTYYQLPKKEFVIEQQEFEALYGNKIPPSNYRAKRPYNLNNTLEDVSHTLVGKIIIMYAARMARTVTQAEEEQEGMMSAMIKEMPFFAIVASGKGMISESMMKGIIELLNGHYIKGLFKLFK
jgi:beta-glucosidase